MLQSQGLAGEQRWPGPDPVKLSLGTETDVTLWSTPATQLYTVSVFAREDSCLTILGQPWWDQGGPTEASRREEATGHQAQAQTSSLDENGHHQQLHRTAEPTHNHHFKGNRFHKPHFTESHQVTRERARPEMDQPPGCKVHKIQRLCNLPKITHLRAAKQPIGEE